LAAALDGDRVADRLAADEPLVGLTETQMGPSLA
jgi:hypothetical protein